MSCSKENKIFSTSDALIDSRPFVLEKLKSPSTTEFCHGDNTTVKINDTTFYVKSCFDSQNGLGAMIRASYSCTIIYHPSIGKYYCNDLLLIEN